MTKETKELLDLFADRFGFYPMHATLHESSYNDPRIHDMLRRVMAKGDTTLLDFSMMFPEDSVQ